MEVRYLSRIGVYISCRFCAEYREEFVVGEGNGGGGKGYRYFLLRS